MKPNLTSKKINIIQGSKLSCFVGQTFNKQTYLGLDKWICSGEVSAKGKLEMLCLHVSRIKDIIDTFPAGLLWKYRRNYCKFSTKSFKQEEQARSQIFLCDPTRRQTKRGWRHESLGEVGGGC